MNELPDLLEKGPMPLIVMWMILLIGTCPACSERAHVIQGRFGRPDISPDGKHIVFVYASHEKGVREIYVSDIDGRNTRQLTHFPEAPIKKGPVWSPEGSKIAFHGDIEDGAQIFVMDKDGSNLKQLTEMEGYNVEPHWSSDADQIAFNSIVSGEKTQMYIMDHDGSSLQKLFNPEGNNWYPRIISDQQMMFTSDIAEGGSYDIFIAHLDGSGLKQLTSTQAINWFPELSPDGTLIAFHSNRDDPTLSDAGNYNIYVMHADGTGLKRITDLPGQELHAKWFPSGDKLIFGAWSVEGESLGLYEVNVETGEVQEIVLRN